MALVLEEIVAEPDLRRWLDFVARPGDRSRRFACGEWWYRHHAGLWFTRRLVEDGAPTRDGRSPDLVLNEDSLADFARLKAHEPTQDDKIEAYKGLRPTLRKDVHGNDRVDFDDIPLKNADGTLTKYAKRMIDLHAPATRVGHEISQKLAAQSPKEVLVAEDGGRLEVPARLADRIARERGLKAAKARGRRRTYMRDGVRVKLVREAGRVVEVKA